MGNMSKEYPFISLLVTSLILFFPSIIKGNEGNDLQINSINAQVIESLNDDVLSLKGNVIIKTNIMELWSDEATYDRKNQLINLKGNIKALSKNLKVDAETMKADFFSKEFYLDNSSFSFKEKAFGVAKKITIKVDTDIELLNVSISSCQNENISWSLNGKEISVVDQGKNVIFRDLKLGVNKFTILRIPFARTAIGKEKFSGFLSPSIKQGDDGLDVSIPYFFNLAPNYDLTVSPRYIQERGLGMATEMRYLTKSSTGFLSLSHFSKDKKFSDTTNQRSKRWFAKYNNESIFGSNLFVKINSENVSDGLYFEDLDDDILGSQQKDYLSRNLLIRWVSKNLEVQGSVKNFRNLNSLFSNDYDTQPRLKINFAKSIGNIKFRLKTDYSKFSFDDSFNPLNKEQELERTSIEPSIYLRKSKNSSTTSLEVGKTKMRHDSSKMSINNSYNWAEFTYRIFMDKFTRDTFSSLSPLFKGIWMDGSNTDNTNIDSKLLNLNFDNLLKRNWYSSSDLFLEESRIIVGLEYNFYNHSSKQERYLSFGKAFFENDNRKLLKQRSQNSSLVSEFKISLSSDIRFNGSLEIDNDLDKIISSSLGVGYFHDKRNKVELRSVFKRSAHYLNQPFWIEENEIINEVELIAQWEVSNSFLLFGKVSRDQNLYFSKDLTYGLEYSNCCLKVGVMKRKWIDQSPLIVADTQERMLFFEDGNFPEIERDNLYFFFELVELGRFGKRISDVLTSKKFQ